MFQVYVDMPCPAKASKRHFLSWSMFSRDQDLQCEVTGTVIDGRVVDIAQRGILSWEKKKKFGAEASYMHPRLFPFSR